MTKLNALRLIYLIDEIILTSDDAVNARKQLDSIDIMARRVGVKIRHRIKLN
jgi:hypothetical protein